MRLSPAPPYAAKLVSDTSNNTVCCTADGNAAIQLARQVSNAGAKTPCSLMKASSSWAVLAIVSRAMALVAPATCGYFRSTEANARVWEYCSRSLLGVLAVRFFDASSIILRYHRCRAQRYI